jgi:hypothetical protein
MVLFRPIFTTFTLYQTFRVLSTGKSKKIQKQPIIFLFLSASLFSRPHKPLSVGQYSLGTPMEGEHSMLKGSQKSMIVVRTKDSRMFEEAYFVIRREADKRAADPTDMLWEANRLIENASRACPAPPAEPEIPRRFGLLNGLLWFGMGFVSGGGAIGLLVWLCTRM